MSVLGQWSSGVVGPLRQKHQIRYESKTFAIGGWVQEENPRLFLCGLERRSKWKDY